jgi:hypothetical protein
MTDAMVQDWMENANIDVSEWTQDAVIRDELLAFENTENDSTGKAENEVGNLENEILEDEVVGENDDLEDEVVGENAQNGIMGSDIREGFHSAPNYAASPSSSIGSTPTNKSDVFSANKADKSPTKAMNKTDKTGETDKCHVSTAKCYAPVTKYQDPGSLLQCMQV